jgi:hypothetical protein
MNREVHVRFWESPEVKVLRATRQKRPSAACRCVAQEDGTAISAETPQAALLGLHFRSANRIPSRLSDVFGAATWKLPREAFIEAYEKQSFGDPERSGHLLAVRRRSPLQKIESLSSNLKRSSIVGIGPGWRAAQGGEGRLGLRWGFCCCWRFRAIDKALLFGHRQFGGVNDDGRR